MHKYIGGDNIIARVTHYDENGKGGYRTLGTLKERDEILEEQLKEGMLVYVQEDGIEYRLKVLEPLTWEVAPRTTGNASIDDSAISTNTTWSSDKINEEDLLVKRDLVDGAPSTADTIGKLARSLNNDPKFSDYVNGQLNNKINKGDSYTTSEAGRLFASKEELHQHDNKSTLDKIQTLPNDKTKSLKGDGSWQEDGKTNWGDIEGSLDSQTDLKAAIDSKSDINHNHDGRYLKPADMQTHLSDYNHDAMHSHLNKTVLDGIRNDGDGTSFLADNGFYMPVAVKDPALIHFTPEEGLIPNRVILRLFFNTDMDETTINSTNIILRRMI